MMVLLGCTGIAARSLAIPEPPDFDGVEHLASTMNREILTTDRYDHYVIEVDWIEGSEPDEDAVKAAVQTIVKYLPPEGSGGLLLSEKISREEWRSDNYAESANRIASEHIDELPPKESRTKLIYVLYVPEIRDQDIAEGLYDMPESIEINRSQSDTAVDVPIILMAKNSFEERVLLRTPAAKVEQAALTHELGHLLGLVNEDRHERDDDSGDCTNSQCVMSKPNWRSYVAGFRRAMSGNQIPLDFGEQCQHDIILAKVSWWAENDRKNE
jgi:hypothetical protein